MTRIVAALLLAGAVEAAESPKPFTPTTGYDERLVEGWTLLVNRDLLAEPDLAQAVLKEVGTQLYNITRKVPAEAVTKLRTVRIWVEKEADKGAAVYHPSREWLADHGYNPDMAKCAQLSNAAHLLAWCRHQPWMVFHELAHAYHHQVVGYDHKEVLDAFDAAKAGGKYDNVLRYDGGHGKHYALSNVQEYWAEGSEAYFGLNDFYPFVNAELKEHDPAMHALLGKLWGVK